jgi:hypothetical protein
MKFKTQLENVVVALDNATELDELRQIFLDEKRPWRDDLSYYKDIGVRINKEQPYDAEIDWYKTHMAQYTIISLGELKKHLEIQPKNRKKKTRIYFVAVDDDLYDFSNKTINDVEIELITEQRDAMTEQLKQYRRELAKFNNAKL